MNNEKYPLLNKINSPEDLRAMPREQMPALCLEIRRFLVENVRITGGHLASNLGVVEMTVAFHRVFDSPTDRLIFDVGHQSYVHKLITGRRDMFPTLRKPGGMSGFTKRSESEHDAFGAGHSSTSVSAALGFAMADRIQGKNSFSVAVLGDGAFTGGMIHEALNNCESNLRFIIILNENEMSISRNIGGFAKYMADIRASRGYNRVKNKARITLSSIPVIGDGLYRAARDTKQFVKNTLYSSNYFEEMGLFYLGPADGNDYDNVERLMYEAKGKGESSIIHLKTKKGKGYAPAEREPNKYHGIPPAGHSEVINFSCVMGEKLAAMAESNRRICAITAAMCESTGLSTFKKKYPRRFFDVGIAEEHALTFSAALAADGMRPYFAVYSSFLQRGYDNIIHDIALQKLPVCMLIDRASFASGDGPTHHGIYDVAMLSAVPELVLYAPMSFVSLEAALEKTQMLKGPSAVRYPNSAEIAQIKEAFAFDSSLSQKLTYEKATTPSTVIVTYGKIAVEALKARDALCERGIDCGVVLLEQLMPYRECAAELYENIRGAQHIVFVEEGLRAAGASMMLYDTLLRQKSDEMRGIRVDILAIDDPTLCGELGVSLYTSAHIGCDDIVATVTAKGE